MCAVALVTGAADPGGIGAACALALAQCGHAVGLLDHRGCDEVVADLRHMGLTATSHRVDLADHTAIPSAVDAVEADMGGSVSILVNCAADLTLKPLDATEPADMQRVLAVNVVAAAMLARRVAPAMSENGFGRIVNIASDTFDRPPGPGFVAYVSAKGALVGLTRALAVELGPAGITVNAISPGLTRTPSLSTRQPAEAFEHVVAAQAIRRPLEPSDYTGALLMLTAPEGQAITGQTIRANAGLTMA